MSSQDFVERRMGARRMRLLRSCMLLILAIFLLSTVASAAEGLAAVIINALIDGIMGIGKLVFGWLGNMFAGVLNALIIFYKWMLLWNPDPYSMAPFTSALLMILAPVYIIAFIVVGVYFVFLSTSPSGRARAKGMLQKMFLSLVLVTVSTPIYAIMLAISGALSSRILAGVSIEGSELLGGIAAIAIIISPHTGFIIPVAFLVIVIVAGIAIGIRHFLTYLMAAIFPLTLFLYFFDFSREIGSKLMKFTISAIFTQVLQALILAVTIASVNSMSKSPGALATLMGLFVGMGGFALMALAPLMMLGLLEWIGGAVAGVGSAIAFMPGKAALGGIMTAAGGVAAGMGAGGLMAGGTVYGLGSSFSASRGPGGGGGGGHGGPAINERMSKEDVLAAEKKKRQTDVHRQGAQGRNRNDVLAERNAKKYDNAKDFGSFFDRVEKENAPPKPHEPSRTEKAQSGLKKAGVGMLALASGPVGWAGLIGYGAYKGGGRLAQTQTGQKVVQAARGAGQRVSEGAAGAGQKVAQKAGDMAESVRRSSTVHRINAARDSMNAAADPYIAKGAAAAQRGADVVKRSATAAAGGVRTGISSAGAAINRVDSSIANAEDKYVWQSSAGKAASGVRKSAADAAGRLGTRMDNLRTDVGDVRTAVRTEYEATKTAAKDWARDTSVAKGIDSASTQLDSMKGSMKRFGKNLKRRL